MFPSPSDCCGCDKGVVIKSDNLLNEIVSYLSIEAGLGGNDLVLFTVVLIDTNINHIDDQLAICQNL